MNQRDVLSLSAIMASQDARRGGFLGLSAVSLHRLLLAIPALCALAYPSLLSWLSAGLVQVHGSASPNGMIVWVSVIGSVTLALAVMLLSFVFGLTLGSSHVGRLRTPTDGQNHQRRKSANTDCRSQRLTPFGTL